MFNRPTGYDESTRRLSRLLGARHRTLAALGSIAMVLAFSGGQCPDPIYTPNPNALPFYRNQSDKTNGGASYVTSAACSACHSDIAALHSQHAHAHALKRPEGTAPTYPANAMNAGVPNPPMGFDWSDISYVIGGYSKGALFLNSDGRILTNGSAGVDAQWNTKFPANGTTAGFAPFQSASPDPLEYEFKRFRKQTTGPIQRGASNPESQDSRAGIEGTWIETGVGCEACHGPGSNHLPNPRRRELFVDPTGMKSCNECHANNFDPAATTIAADQGFILPNQQATELRASGGHAGFKCGICHDPHVSLTVDAARAIRNDCTACHTDMNMALHAGKVFTRGEYVEPLTCVSCHMPFATRAYSAAGAAVVGNVARMGDTRTHVFRIAKNMNDFTAFFTADGSEVELDNQGRAAVTVDFVCLRCHNGNGAFPLSVQSAGDITPNIHLNFGN